MNYSNSVDINGDKIRLLREQKELTQLYLATVVGVTTDTISRWENRRYPAIKLDNARKLAEALGVPLEELLDDTAREKQAPLEESSAGAGAEGLATATKARWVAVVLRSKKSIVVSLLACAVGLVAYFLLSGGHSGVRVVRILPKHTAPNVPFPVIIHATGEANAQNTLLIREELKGDCEAKGPGSEGDAKPFGQNPRWIGKLENGRADFIYIVTPGKKLKQDDTITFTGDTISREGQTTGDSIGGASSVTILPYHWADTDKDYVISDSEILNAYETYSISGESPINFSEVEELWMAGKYAWNRKTMAFVPAGTGSTRE